MLARDEWMLYWDRVMRAKWFYKYINGFHEGLCRKFYPYFCLEKDMPLVSSRTKLLYTSSFDLFVSGDYQLHQIMPQSRVMLWCRDMAGNSNSEQNRPIFLITMSKFRRGSLWMLRNLTPLDLFWACFAKNRLYFLLWRIFNTPDQVIDQPEVELFEITLEFHKQH